MESKEELNVQDLGRTKIALVTSEAAFSGPSLQSSPIFVT